MTIRVKLSIAMILMIVLSTLVMGGITVFKSADTVQNLTESTMTEITDENATIIESMINKEVRNIELIADQKEVQDVLVKFENGEALTEVQNQLNEKLMHMVKDAGNIEHIFIVNNKGIIIADSDTKLIGTDINDRGYTKKVLEKKEFVISETLKSKSSGAYVTAFVHPVFVNDRMVGFAAAVVTADSIMKYLADTQILETESSYAAARAGEAGKGFAVVADEIRKLAEQSSATASGIQGIVKNVYSSVGNMKDNSESILNFVDQNVLKDYEKLTKVSEQYNSDAEYINNLMSEFETSAGQLDTAVSSISTAMNEVAATVNESAKGVQGIAEKTTEIVDKTVFETKLADENSQGAKVLFELVERFKI